MTVKIIGDTANVQRIITKMYSFDLAFENSRGEIGFPLSPTEIYGPTSCGKSTFCYSLVGMLGTHLQESIVLADFEGFDPVFLEDILTHSGYSGDVIVVQKESDGKTLDALVDLYKEGHRLGILDSVGAISPISEATGELEEANMGRRAFLIGQFSRKMLPYTKNHDRVLLITNHVHPRFGGFGITTPGGETKKYLICIQIRIKRKEEFPDQSYVLEGTIIKNRFGYRNRKFYVFVLSGKGIHLGLTAMYDCFIYGKAERGKTIKIGDEKFGYLKNLVKAAHDGEENKFQPFYDALVGE